MTTIEAPAIFEIVNPPSIVPYRFGLMSVLEFTDEGRGLGITWESDGCYVAGYTTDRCLDPEVTDLTPTSCEPILEATPFTVYVLAEDSIAGMDDDEWTGRATSRLTAGEQKGVEAWMAATLAADVTPTDAPTGGTAAEAALLALASAEQGLAESSGTEGTIIIDRFTATLLSDELTVTGGRLYTKLGTKVAAIGEDLDDVIYAVGPFKATRTAIETSNGTPGGALSRNDISVLSQRTYNIGWECTALGYTAVTA